MADISKIKTLDGTTYDISSIRTKSVPTATVDSTSTSTSFTVQVPEFENETGPRDGLFFYIYNNKVTSASGYTINVNNWGAKPVYNTQCERTTTGFSVSKIFPIWYSSTLVEGGCWIIGYLSDANTNTIGYLLRTNSTVMKTYDQSRYYRIFFTSADRTHWVPANTAKDNSATSAKTVNQRPIDPFGRIIYFGATTNLSAESDVSATYCWDQYALSLGYSFNMNGNALTLTTKTPVYIKCAPQSDGSAIIDSTTPYVQSLPSSEDGKIYIFLGVAYSATNIELVQCHPIYCYKDGAIRLWTNQNTNAEKVNGYTVSSNVPANAVFTDTTYTANTSKLVTTTVPNVTSVGSAPTLGAEIAADDITSWTTNTPTSFVVTGEKLSITTGTAASLNYTERSIPNVTSVGSVPMLGTAITVATGSLSSNGSGDTVATGISES